MESCVSRQTPAPKIAESFVTMAVDQRESLFKDQCKNTHASHEPRGASCRCTFAMNKICFPIFDMKGLQFDSINVKPLGNA